MTDPSNLIKITVEGLFKCQSRPTSTGLTALAAVVGLLDDAETAVDFVVDGDPQAPTSSRTTNAEANRNLHMTFSPGSSAAPRGLLSYHYYVERCWCTTVTVPGKFLAAQPLVKGWAGVVRYRA